jgi:superkiller protein 3
VPALGGWRGEGAIYAWVADFLAYPAVIGIIVPVIGGLTYWVSRIPRHALRIRFGIGALLTGFLVALCIVQASPYRSEIELWMWTLAEGGPSALAYERLGVALLERNAPFDGQRALQALYRGQALDPTSTRAATYLGLARESLGQWADAIAEYRQALVTSPDSADLHARLAAAYARMGNVAEAEREYHSALNLRPRDAAIHNSLGLVLALAGRWTEAIDQYHLALELDPDQISAQLHLADAEYRRGNFDAAANLLQEIIRKDPQHPNYEALMNAGFILHQHREYAKAEQMFKVAVQVNPRSPEAHNALGMVQAAQGRLDEAILNFEQALDLNAEYEEARQNLEAARRQRGPGGLPTTR